MEIVKNSAGYAPLLVNLEPYFEKPLAELPNEIKEIIKGRTFLADNWDLWSVEQRRHLAAQDDYEHDPTREPVLRFEIENLHTRLGEFIDQAEHHREHAAVTYLRKVEDRLKAIKEVDRERVGSEIMQLREEAVRNLNNDASQNRSNQVAGKSPQSEITCMRGLAVMAWLLAENKSAMRVAKRPNAKQIGDAVRELAKKHFGEDVRGFDSFNKKVNDALKELQSED